MVQHKVRVLLVDDDVQLAWVIKKNLEDEGYKVVYCCDGEMAWRKFQRETFDICLLDIAMPKKDGLALTQEIRKRNMIIPILFLTSRTLEEDRLEGFKIGGDDYITKPFSMRELLLRMKVFLRRNVTWRSDNVASHTIGKLTFKYELLEVVDDQQQKIGVLTPRETMLLKYLVENANKILKRSDILLNIWGKEDFFSRRSMDVFITKLRKHLRADPNIHLETLHNVGFRLNVP